MISAVDAMKEQQLIYNALMVSLENKLMWGYDKKKIRRKMKKHGKTI